jgi:hypothetical protein
LQFKVGFFSFAKLETEIAVLRLTRTIAMALGLFVTLASDGGKKAKGNGEARRWKRLLLLLVHNC